MSVESLHGRDICDRPPTAVADDVQLEPGNIIRRRAGRVADHLACHGAAVRILPGRTSVMTPDRLAVEEQCCDRLSERPTELAVAARLTLVDLRPFALEGRDLCYAGCGTRRRHLRHRAAHVNGDRQGREYQ